MTASRRIAGAALVAALVAALIAVFTPSPAYAAPAGCTTRWYVCGYVDIQFKTGQGWELDPFLAPGTCDVVAYRNAWSSVWNSGYRAIRLYRNTTCTGSDYKGLRADRGVYRISLLWGPTWDNSIDAIMYE